MGEDSRGARSPIAALGWLWRSAGLASPRGVKHGVSLGFQEDPAVFRRDFRQDRQ